LLRAAIQAGRRLGFTDARLTVYTDTPDALHMYETEGFRERSRVAQLDWQWRQADGNRGEGSLG
jgi:ribosomal protein S18 acetylase RimI-like enzyme